jgi:hypothetical protein
MFVVAIFFLMGLMPLIVDLYFCNEFQIIKHAYQNRLSNFTIGECSSNISSSIGLATTIFGFGYGIFSFMDFGKSMTISRGIGKFTYGLISLDIPVIVAFHGWGCQQKLEVLSAFVPGVQFAQDSGNFLPDLELFCLHLQDKVYPLFSVKLLASSSAYSTILSNSSS